MGRKLGAHRLESIYMVLDKQPRDPGATLGKLTIEGHVPVCVLAEVLQVSEPTVYRWMYGAGKPCKTVDVHTVNLVITILRGAKRTRQLPMTGTLPVRIHKTQEIFSEYRNRLLHLQQK